MTGGPSFLLSTPSGATFGGPGVEMELISHCFPILPSKLCLGSSPVPCLQKQQSHLLLLNLPRLLFLLVFLSWIWICCFLITPCSALGFEVSLVPWFLLTALLIKPTNSSSWRIESWLFAALCALPGYKYVLLFQSKPSCFRKGDALINTTC